MERILSTAIEKTKRILEESRQLIQRLRAEASDKSEHSTFQNLKSILASPDA
jgi:vacuolar-type H+-ATPase subunit E/Vma4